MSTVAPSLRREDVPPSCSLPTSSFTTSPAGSFSKNSSRHGHSAVVGSVPPELCNHECRAQAITSFIAVTVNHFHGATATHQRCRGRFVCFARMVLVATVHQVEFVCVLRFGLCRLSMTLTLTQPSSRNRSKDTTTVCFCSRA